MFLIFRVEGDQLANTNLGARGVVSPLSLVKNPMILMAIVALALTLGMPKLMENSTCMTPQLWTL